MFIVDFDDTLFDTHAFKQARLEAVKQVGVPEEIYWQTYREARNHSALFTYSNERHAEMLALRGFSKEVVLRALQSTTGEKIKRFLFSDAVAFLTFLKSYGDPLILLSLGNQAMQELKVRGTKLYHYFDRVFYVDDTKEKVLQELFNRTKPDTVWLFNDKVNEVKALKDVFPQMQVALRKSDSISEDEYRAGGLPYFNSLTEIQEYVKEHMG
ncbi:MAG TPA: HAD family hydrolase [Patescibacteria group bacterium]|nr:HAD family hydrolase [Patescibacteria group bacterium]